jgi:predicted nuclease of predicted toxin-antitoxin system
MKFLYRGGRHMKFLADMGIAPNTVAYLRQLGHEAAHLSEQHLECLTDRGVVEKARSEDRVLLTHDLDFGGILAAMRSRLPSVITFRLHNMQPQNVRRHLAAVIAAHETLLAQGAMISVTEGRIRIRRLPM